MAASAEELQVFLQSVAKKHQNFLRRYPGGELADLRNKDLRAVQLPGFDLRQALLAGANLQGIWRVRTCLTLR